MLSRGGCWKREREGERERKREKEYNLFIFFVHSFIQSSSHSFWWRNSEPLKWSGMKCSSL